MTETLVDVSPPSPKEKQGSTEPGGPAPAEAFGPIPDAGAERELTAEELAVIKAMIHSGQGRWRWPEWPGRAAEGVDEDGYRDRLG